MTVDQFRPLVDALLPAVLAAGRIEMRHFAPGVEVTTKADTSPVTIADHEAEEALLAGLAQAAPGVPVVAEERVAAGRIPATREAFFLVDPLDGTRAFIRQSPEFTINIGLIEHGVPVFGIIYAPAMQLLFATLAPHRAVEIAIAPDFAGAGLADCQLKPLHTRAPNPHSLVAFASRSHAAASTDAFLSRLPIPVTEKRKASSSIKFCYIARGEADLYARLGETSEWDTAAGHAILAAAGGTVMTAEGEPLRYGKAAQRFANPYFVAWGRGPLF